MQHLLHLRRIILSRANARVDFVSRHGQPQKLYCSAGGFIGERHDIVPALRELLDARTGKAYKLKGDDPFSGRPVTKHALSLTDALRDFEIDDSLEQEFGQFFERFPRVSIRLVPLYKSGFSHYLYDYTKLHARSVRQGYVDLKGWIEEAAEDDARKSRMMLFMIMLCLGIVSPARDLPAARQATGEQATVPEQGVIERIIQRMREL